MPPTTTLLTSSPLKIGEGPRKKGCGDNSQSTTSESLWNFKFNSFKHACYRVHRRMTRKLVQCKKAVTP